MPKLKTKKVLQTGGKSKYVWLLEGNVIKKAYKKGDKKQAFRFTREVKLLKHLSNCPFVPKLLQVDYKQAIIYMSYVG